MIAHAEPQGSEKALLEALRADYEARGFTYVVEPDVDALPSFLQGFCPDAVAHGPGRNVAVVVKRRRGRPDAVGLADIRRLFADQPDWQFRIVVPASDPLDAVVIDEATPEAVQAQQAEVRALSAQGHRRAAFVMAWSVLEAALRSAKGGTGARAQDTAGVIQSLAMYGFVEPETEHRLRSLVALRNRIVHGDLGAEPDQADVDTVVSAVDEAMDLAAA